MKKLLTVTAMFLMVAVGAFPPAACATPTLWLWDGINSPIIVVDGGSLDRNPEAGAVTYIGAVGTNWKINVTTGITTPAMGSPSSPSMDLNSVDQDKITGVGHLTLMFSEIGYILSGPALATMTIGGTTPGITGVGVTYQTYFNNDNVLFDITGGLIGARDLIRLWPLLER